MQNAKKLKSSKNFQKRPKFDEIDRSDENYHFKNFVGAVLVEKLRKTSRKHRENFVKMFAKIRRIRFFI